MNVLTQIKVRSNPNIYKYLREYSYWYKYLNRNPSSIKELEKEMKSRYKLTAKDRLEKITDSMNLIYSLMDVLQK